MHFTLQEFKRLPRSKVKKFYRLAQLQKWESRNFFAMFFTGEELPLPKEIDE